MARFTKYRNPNKKRRYKKLDYTERTIAAIQEAQFLTGAGYSYSADYLNKKYNIPGYIKPGEEV